MYSVLCSRAKAERESDAVRPVGESAQKDEKTHRTGTHTHFFPLPVCVCGVWIIARITGRRHRSSSIEKSRRLDMIEEKKKNGTNAHVNLSCSLNLKILSENRMVEAAKHSSKAKCTSALHSRDKNVNFYQLYKNKFFTILLFEKLLSSAREFYPWEWNFRNTVMQSIVFMEPFHKTWYSLQRLFYSYPHVTHQYKYNKYFWKCTRVTNININIIFTNQKLN